MRYGIIANPKSGKLSIDDKRVILEHASSILQDCKIYGLDTCSAEEFRSCADEVSRKVGTLVVAGGDGTLHDVINSVSQEALLSYLPLGSGNAIKYALSLPETISETAEQIKKGNKHSLDLILCDNSKKTFVADVGLGGYIMNEREKNLHKGKKGRLAYALASVGQALEYERGNATVVVDNEKLSFNNIWSFVLTKIRCGGYGLNVMPKARLDDGYIHFLAIDSNWLELFYGLTTAFLGKNKVGRYIACKKVQIVTSKKEYLEIGGDVDRKDTNFVFEILPGCLQMKY